MCGNENVHFHLLLRNTAMQKQVNKALPAECVQKSQKSAKHREHGIIR